MSDTKDEFNAKAQKLYKELSAKLPFNILSAEAKDDNTIQINMSGNVEDLKQYADFPKEYEGHPVTYFDCNEM